MTPSNAQPLWVLVLRGALLIAFGVLAFLWPGLTLLMFVALFAAYALLTGLAAITGAVRGDKAKGGRWLPLLLGMISIGAAAAAFLYPGVTALVLVLVIGIHAFAIGILDVVAATQLPKKATGRALLGVSGVLSVLFGALIFFFPSAGAFALVWLISLYAIVAGILLLAAAISLRRAPDDTRGAERRVNPDRRQGQRMSHSHSS